MLVHADLYEIEGLIEVAQDVRCGSAASQALRREAGRQHAPQREAGGISDAIEEVKRQKERGVAMRRMILAATLAGALVGGGIAAAQAPGADDHAAHHPAAKPSAAAPAAPGKPGPAPMMNGMCPMMGGGMGGGMMGGMGPMMGGAATKVDVKKIDKGVTITMTSADPATVARLQKMAEAMRLMHEATSQ